MTDNGKNCVHYVLEYASNKYNDSITMDNVSSKIYQVRLFAFYFHPHCSRNTFLDSKKEIKISRDNRYRNIEG